MFPVMSFRTNTPFFLTSTLTGIPIAGEILARSNGEYFGLIAFTTVCYALGLACCTAVKVLEVGWRRPLAIY